MEGQDTKESVREGAEWAEGGGGGGRVQRGFDRLGPAKDGGRSAVKAASAGGSEGMGRLVAVAEVSEVVEAFARDEVGAVRDCEVRDWSFEEDVDAGVVARCCLIACVCLKSILKPSPGWLEMTLRFGCVLLSSVREEEGEAGVGRCIDGRL